VRKHPAVNESPKLTLDEQGRAAFVVTSIEIQQEGLQVFAWDAVQLCGTRRTYASPLASEKRATHGTRLDGRRSSCSFSTPISQNTFSVDFRFPERSHLLPLSPST